MTKMRRMEVVLAVAVLLPSSAAAQQIISGTNRFTHITCELMLGCVTAANGACDCTKRIVQESIFVGNPGAAGGLSPGGDLCADLYVFRSDQAMTECCGCKVTPDGLLTLGLRTDLLSNPLTGLVGASGTVRIVSSTTNAGSCDPSQPNPTPALTAWATHLQVNTSGTGEFTETAFKDATLSGSELSKLAAECGFIQVGGSGKGICKCPASE